MAELPPSPPSPPISCFSVGVTGHRQPHPGYAAAVDGIEAALGAVMDRIAQAVTSVQTPFGAAALAPIRLHTLLVDGTDQVAARLAAMRGWDIVSPLPFGRALNLAINSLPGTAADARALLAGAEPTDPETRIRAKAITAVAATAHLFELADQDEAVAALYLAMLDAPQDHARTQAFQIESARRAGLAGKVLVEQSDLVIAVWDGKSTANPGGAGDTVARALDNAAPVVWINPADPHNWRMLHAPESLALTGVSAPDSERDAALIGTVWQAMHPEAGFAAAAGDTGAGPRQFLAEPWHPVSTRWAHGYRRIEALFGGGKGRLRSLVQRYEPPEEVADGSGAELRAVTLDLPGADRGLADAIQQVAMRNFAWADGIAARMSDVYRGGMIVNFVLSALAIVGGVAYLPFASVEDKWFFALFEFVLLLAIVTITLTGQRRRWHARWFETRRVAEYFRHSPLMLMLGAARPPGLWPRAAAGSWPEWYVRQALRSIGLPRATITAPYLRAALKGLLQCHVIPQRDYHFAKAGRLKKVHHNLDRLSEGLFGLALLSVASYLALKGLAAAGRIDPHAVYATSKVFTMLGVLFPTFGAAVAGIRYFGDFERFAAISEVTAEKLDGIADRAGLLLAAPPAALDYGQVTALVHAADDVVVSEIENWQSVFGGKNITVPV